MIHFRLILGMILSLLIILWVAKFLYCKHKKATLVISVAIIFFAIFCMWRFVSMYGELYDKMQARTMIWSQNSAVMPFIIDGVGIFVATLLVFSLFKKNQSCRKD